MTPIDIFSFHLKLANFFGIVPLRYETVNGRYFLKVSYKTRILNRFKCHKYFTLIAWDVVTVLTLTFDLIKIRTLLLEELEWNPELVDMDWTVLVTLASHGINFLFSITDFGSMITFHTLPDTICAVFNNIDKVGRFEGKREWQKIYYQD